MVILGIYRTIATVWGIAPIRAAKTAIHRTRPVVTGIAAAVAPIPTRTPQQCVWAPVVPTAALKRKSLTAMVRVRVATAAARPAAVVIAVRVAVARVRAQKTVSVAIPMATIAPVLAVFATTASLVVVLATTLIIPIVAAELVSTAAIPSVRAMSAVGIATIRTEITQPVAVQATTTTTTARVTMPAGVVSQNPNNDILVSATP